MSTSGKSTSENNAEPASVSSSGDAFDRAGSDEETGREPSKKGRLTKLKNGVGRLTRPRQRFPMPAGAENGGLRIAIATDAWKPQVNGVVRALDTLGAILTGFGNEVLYVTPEKFHSVPLPSYSEIRLAILPNRRVAKMLNDFKPDAIHIATEGPIGRAARRFCKRRRYPFTTSFHTRFAEYANARWSVPLSWGYAILRDFHKDGETMMVATQGMMDEMGARGFNRMKLWPRGVDLEQFRQGESAVLDAYPGPRWLYVGRIAVEKSIEDFLELDLPGSKIIIGDGPQRAELETKYKDVHFLGSKFGDELTAYYQASDVFVFPSRTDTFGLVNVEALACGVAVASYPVRGPLEIFEGAPPACGALNEDLRAACLAALEHRDPAECRAWAERFSWDAASRHFIANLETPGFDEDFWLRSAKMID